MSRDSPWAIAVVVFLAVAVGAFIGYSYVASQRIDRPTVATTNSAGTTGSSARAAR